MQVGNGAHLRNPATLENHDPPAERPRILQIVAHNDPRYRELGQAIDEKAPDFRARVGIEPGGRLIEEQRPRSDGKRTAQGHTLRFAAGERPAAAAGEVSDAQLGKQGHRLIVAGGLAAANAKTDIAEDGHVGKQGAMLGDVTELAMPNGDIDSLFAAIQLFAAKLDAPAAGRYHSEQTLEQRRFARPVGPHNNRRARMCGELDP
ncbi:MAG TPA: hypothetical protein VFG83_06155 [Kofleriaceae bacterium]|nr:hypothetical protein [Kofleriaceae bacterium]